MKNWKSYIAGILFFCLCLLMPFAVGIAEEETEEPIPDSYYYTIESNEIKDWPQGPSIESAAAVVLDVDTGTFLYSKQATEKMYPASTTKIMTTLLLLEKCDLDDTITFSEIVYDLEEGSSHLGIQPGEEMSIRDAAYGIMLASANDISNGIAEYIGGSLSGFAEMMNEKAAELGCINTHFSNPHGLYSDDHYTCAYDMALIAAAAYDNPMFREIVGTKEYTIPETNLTDEQRSFLNHHKMLQSDSEYYQTWCTGGKTGFTSQCLNTLVTFAEESGRRYIAVVFRVNGAGKAYSETTQILQYAMENFIVRNYKKSTSEKTFYGIMGFEYLGKAADFQSSVWTCSPVREACVNMILPKENAEDQLTYELVQTDGNKKTISYKYNGQEVGSASGGFLPVYVPAQLIFEKDVPDSDSTGSFDLDTDIQIDSFDEVVSQAAVIFDVGCQLVQEYAQEHTLVTVAAAGIFLILVVIFLVVLIFRGTADARIKRKRKQEEIERKRREEEIEKMTTAEIEAELRAVMEQERLRKEQQAEAERAVQNEKKYR